MPLITMTRNIGSGGSTIARHVAEELDLELYDDRKLQEEAVRMGVKSEELEGIDEKVPGLFDRIFSQKPDVYLDLMEAVVYDVAKKGQGIIMGHGSQILLREFGCALHVRAFASEAFRIQNLMNQQGLSHEMALKLIHKSDHELEGFLRFSFHKDWNDISLYDLVINTEKLGTKLPVEMILESARSDEIKECSMTAMDAMERLSLSKNVEAVILKSNIDLQNLHLEVPEKGLVEVSGWTNTKAAKKHLMRVVKDVPGVSEAQDKVAVVAIGL
jgi:cytidylate kinase